MNEVNYYREAHDVAQVVMNNGWDWAQDAPALMECAGLLYQHYQRIYPTFFWNQISLEILQGLIRGTLLTWADQEGWDAPNMNEAQEDVIWGWLSDIAVRKLHTGVYR